MSEIRLETRAVLKVSGAEARPFLQGIITNDVDALTPEQPLWAALLGPQGKVLFDFLLFDGGEGAVMIDCEAARAHDLARRLAMYKLRRDVAVERTGLNVLSGGDGPPDPRLAALGPRWLGDGSAPDGAGAYAMRRIALGVPEGAAELGVDKTLWLEANAVELRGVSFTKGCYVGQENTARMHHRDKVRRRMLPVAIDGDPGPESALSAGGSAAGELRVRAGNVGMAWLRLEHADKPLSVGAARAQVLWPDWLPR